MRTSHPKSIEMAQYKVAPRSWGANSNSLDIDSRELKCQLEQTILVICSNRNN